MYKCISDMKKNTVISFRSFLLIEFERNFISEHSASNMCIITMYYVTFQYDFFLIKLKKTTLINKHEIIWLY